MSLSCLVDFAVRYLCLDKMEAVRGPGLYLMLLGGAMQIGGGILMLRSPNKAYFQ